MEIRNDIDPQKAFFLIVLDVVIIFVIWGTVRLAGASPAWQTFARAFLCMIMICVSLTCHFMKE